MHWCPAHQRWENESEAARPFGFADPLSVLAGSPAGMARTGAPNAAMMPSGASVLTPPVPSSPAMPGGTSTATSIPLQASTSPAQRPTASPSFLRTTPASARAMPAGGAQAAIPSGPPAWYTQVHSVAGGALVTAVSTVASDPYTENARDAFYLDRLTEFLRSWADDLQKRAAPLRKAPPFH